MPSEIEILRAENERLQELVTRAEERGGYTPPPVSPWMSRIECEWCTSHASRIVNTRYEDGLPSYRLICDVSHGIADDHTVWTFDEFNAYLLSEGSTP